MDTAWMARFDAVSMRSMRASLAMPG